MKGTKRTINTAPTPDVSRGLILDRLGRALRAGRFGRVVLAGSSTPPPEGAHDPRRPRIFLLLAGCRHVKLARAGRAHEAWLSRGDILFCNSDSWHAVIPDRRHVLISLLFDRMYTSVNWKRGAGATDQRNLQYVAPPQLSAATRHALRALESLRPEGHDAPAAMHLSRALLGLALEDLHRVGVLPSRARRTYHGLREYMEENYHRPIDREHLAARFDLHPNHVSRLFRRMAGEGFAAALRRLRLEAAERMLRETDASVKEVALACGFSSANYFGKVFRRHRGASPGAWR